LKTNLRKRCVSYEEQGLNPFLDFSRDEKGQGSSSTNRIQLVSRRFCFFSGFFETDLVLWKLRFPKRWLFPLLVVLAAKLVGGLFIYYWMNIGTVATFWFNPSRVFDLTQNEVLLRNLDTTSKVPSLFVGWDSAWYLSIVEKGYGFSAQSYTFSPGFPFFTRLLNFFLGNPLISLVICGLVFGVLWIPIYQALAERFIGKKAALASALLFAFSPYVFLFTTVAYSEGLLLFFTLAAWYLFERRKTAYASAFAIAAPLMRTMGILVAFPLILSSLKQKNRRKLGSILLSVMPIIGLVLWLAFLGLSTGDLLAPVHTTEWNGMYTVRSLLLQNSPQKALQTIFEAPYKNWPATPFWFSPVAIAAALIVPPFLIFRAAKIDKNLMIYSLVGYCGILFFGAIVSTPRFVSMLFPLWIPLTAKWTLNKKSIIIIILVISLSFLLALDMWTSFLNGQFVA
jgi:hypothetical protein